ncbi:MAG: diguanylate cyclase [Desulfamplus sp.]|nr:diguanylate cyclase [Desulfamplus sp.]
MPSQKISNLKPVYIWTIGLCVILIILTASVIELLFSHSSAINKASEQTRTTSYLIAEWISSSLSIPKYILKDVAADVNSAELQYPSDNQIQQSERTNLLIRKAKTDQTILFLGLFDKRCTITHTSIGSNLGLNCKNREYCWHVFQKPINTFKMSNMFISSTNKMNVTVSYPVLNPDHEIAGFALIGLDLSFFQRWLYRLSLTDGISVSIFDSHQQLLARVPFAKTAIGKRLEDTNLNEFVASNNTSELTFRKPSPIDGIDRIWTFRRVQDLPFIIVSGISVKEALSAWWVKLVLYVIGNILLTSLIFLGVRLFNDNQHIANLMKEQASTDPLTGLANRRRFVEMLRLNIEEAKRYKVAFTVIIIDIDHFKRVNDTHGHDVGDQVLQAFSKITQIELRTSDVLARWGGEEFIVLLPYTNQDKGALLAERLRISVDNCPINQAIHISISLGLSEYRENDTADTIVKRADEALYCAKNEGRNRIKIAP